MSELFKRDEKQWKNSDECNTLSVVAYFCPLYTSYVSLYYVGIKDNYVNMQHKYVNMQNNSVDMQEKM
jgi:hypothetical protein